VTDWRIARARLHGSSQLEEVFSRARLLRLLRATDALAWGLNDIWDGRASYRVPPTRSAASSPTSSSRAAPPSPTRSR
jgi:DNA helicase-2/ATP-dependent DNA helicase PcrA